jgi:hypothetical protein
MHFGTARKLAIGGAAAVAVVLGACGDSRIGKLSAGISRDSALKVINEGSAGDSLARVYKQEAYIYNGRMINVLLYNKDGAQEASDPSVPDSKLTPIVSVDGKVSGWGWAHYDSVAKANNIPVREHK